MFGIILIDVFTLMIKTQRRQFVPVSKVSNVEIFYDHGGLENKIKVKFMTGNKRSCH